MSNWLASQLSIISNFIKAGKGTNPITNDAKCDWASKNGPS